MRFVIVDNITGCVPVPECYESFGRKGEHMTLSELWGLGTAQNPNVGRILLVFGVMVALYLPPLVLHMITKKKIWIIVAFVIGMLICLGLAALSILLCSNYDDAIHWLKLAGIYLVVFPIHVWFLRWMRDMNDMDDTDEMERFLS